MIDHQLWQIVGWTMLHYFWVGAALGAVALLARHGLRSATAGMRYLLALGSLLLLSLAPAVIALVVMQNLAPTADSVPLSPADSASRPEAMHFEQLRPTLTATDTTDTEALQTPSGERLLAALNLAAMCLPWLWVCGAPFSFALTTAGLLGAERLRRQSHPLEDAQITEVCRRLAASLKISLRVSVALCDRIAAPILVGVFRPMILLPAAALAGWDPQQLEMVLLHELAHVRRHDNLVNLLQRIVESLLFFQPMVWIISGWVRQEREHCCDALVVARTHQPHAYAEILVNLAENQNTLRSSLLAHPHAVLSMAERPLVARVRRILKKEEQSMQVSRKVVSLVFLCALALMLMIGGYYSLPSNADDSSTSSTTAKTPAAPPAAASATAPARLLKPVTGKNFVVVPFTSELQRGRGPGYQPSLQKIGLPEGAVKELEVKLQLTADDPSGKTSAKGRSGASRDESKLSSGVKKVLQALDSPTAVKCIDRPLKDAVDDLAKQHAIEIRFDRNTLREVGIAIDTPMTRTVKKSITLDSGLRLILGDLLLVPIIQDDSLLITTEEKSRQLVRQGAIDPAAYPMPNKAAATRKIADILTKTGSLSLSRTPLWDMPDIFAAQYGCNLQLDYRGLGDAGVKADVPCSITLKDVSLDSALRQLLAKHGLSYVVRDEVILITAAVNSKPAVGVKSPGSNAKGKVARSDKDSPHDGNRIIARLGSDTIAESEVAVFVNERLEKSKGKLPSDQLEKLRQKLVRQRLNSLIETKLIYQDAQRGIPSEGWAHIEAALGKQFEDVELNKMMKKEGVTSPNELDQKFHSLGTSLEQEKQSSMELTLARQWIGQQVKHDVEITPEQMLLYYRAHPKEFTTLPDVVKPFGEAQVEIKKKIIQQRMEKRFQDYMAKLHARTVVWTIFDGRAPGGT